MNAIKIVYKGQQINIETEFMSTIFIYQNYGAYFVESGGTEWKSDGTEVSHKWLDTKMAEGDTIEVEILENENQVSSSTIQRKIELPESVASFQENIDEFHKRLIAKFYTLQHLLMKEGLLK